MTIFARGKRNGGSRLKTYRLCRFDASHRLEQSRRLTERISLPSKYARTIAVRKRKICARHCVASVSYQCLINEQVAVLFIVAAVLIIPSQRFVENGRTGAGVESASGLLKTTLRHTNDGTRRGRAGRGGAERSEAGLQLKKGLGSTQISTPLTV